MTTDLDHGRGWLGDAAAASIRRIDRALGHPLQITEAGRTWARQWHHWLIYQRDGWPLALHPDTPSIHQLGNAVDSDEGQQHLALMAEHGWKRTVYRRGKLVEPWHFEYAASRDRHRFDPTPAGQPSNPAVEPEPEEDTMSTTTVHARIGDDGTETEWMLGHPEFGKDLPEFDGDATDENSRLTADKSIKIFRGFMVTVNRDIFTSWARTYAKGTGQITSRTDRDGYVEIQKQLSRVATELTA